MMFDGTLGVLEAWW